VNAVQVDEQRRLLLPMLKPGDYYAPEFHGESEIVLRKIEQPERKRTKEKILRAIEKSPIRFTASWDDLKAEIR